MAIRITRGSDLAIIAADCRRVANGKVVLRELRKDIRKSVVPIRAAVRERALEILPSSGGLNAWVARSRITGVVLTGANSAGIKIRGTRNLITGKSGLKSIDAGAVRHPVYSNRGQ
jgi:hypothetical protein